VTNLLDYRLNAGWPGYTGRTASIGLRWRTNAID
jgi:hypothetical protein